MTHYIANINSLTLAGILGFFILLGLAIGFTVNYTPYFTQYICQDRAGTWKTGINRYFVSLFNTKKNQEIGGKILDHQPNRHIHQWLAIWGVTRQQLDDYDLRNISTPDDFNRLSDLVSSLKGEMTVMLRTRSSRQKVCRDVSSLEENNVVYTSTPEDIGAVSNIEEKLLIHYGEKIEISPPQGKFFSINRLLVNRHQVSFPSGKKPGWTWFLTRNVTGEQLILDDMLPRPGPGNQPGPEIPRVTEIQPAPEMQPGPSNQLARTSSDAESLGGLSLAESIAPNQDFSIMNPRDMSRHDWDMLVAKGQRLILRGEQLDKMYILDKKHYGLFPRDGPGDTSNRPYADAKELSPQNWDEIVEIAGGRRIVVFGENLEKMYLVDAKKSFNKIIRLIQATDQANEDVVRGLVPAFQAPTLADNVSVSRLAEFLNDLS